MKEFFISLQSSSNTTNSQLSFQCHYTSINFIHVDTTNPTLTFDGENHVSTNIASK